MRRSWLREVMSSFGEDLAQVVLDGAQGQEQPGADLRVRQAVAGQPGRSGPPARCASRCDLHRMSGHHPMRMSPGASASALRLRICVMLSRLRRRACWRIGGGGPADSLADQDADRRGHSSQRRHAPGDEAAVPGRSAADTAPARLPRFQPNRAVGVRERGHHDQAAATQHAAGHRRPRKSHGSAGGGSLAPG